jgi:hypothetical protein
MQPWAAAGFSKRFSWRRLASSSEKRGERAKEECRTGRLDIVSGDEEEFVPLPGLS